MKNLWKLNAGNFSVTPECSGHQVTDAELIQALDGLRTTIISVATGGPRIQGVQSQFQESYDLVATELISRQIPNPLPYRELWQWQGRWSSGDLPTYASRRAFVADLFDPLLKQLRSGFSAPVEATGWTSWPDCRQSVAPISPITLLSH